MMERALLTLVNAPSPEWCQTLLKDATWLHRWVGSEAFIENLHSVVYVALFYHLCYVLSKWYLFPPAINWRLSREAGLQKNTSRYSRRYNALAIQSGIHLVSLLQTIVVLYLSLRFLTRDDAVTGFHTARDRVFGYTRETEVVCIYACGYFLWDAVISLLYSTPAFFLHGLISLVVFMIGLTPYISYYAPVFLMFELSNPFLNIRWFGLKYLDSEGEAASNAEANVEEHETHPSRSQKFAKMFLLLNNLVFMIVFFLSRIVWGWYQIIRLCMDFWAVRHESGFKLCETAVIVVGNLVLDVLNAIWFSTMVTVAIKVMCGRKPKTE